jgi:hypothetical protein
MLGTSYHVEPDDTRICYELVTDPSRLSLISVWKHNRPPDPTRVEEIQEYTTRTKLGDGQILLAVVDGKCVCYDGAHRLCAYRSCFPSGGVQVRIIHDSSNEEIRREFERVNRSVPVPELYFSEDEISLHISSLSQNVARGLCETYPSYVSTSRRPRRPNFNRDSFTEELGLVIKGILSNETILGLNVDTIGTWLLEVNQIIQVKHRAGGTGRIRASPTIIEKCERHKFFLFAADWKTVLTSYIQTKYPLAIAQMPDVV